MKINLTRSIVMLLIIILLYSSCKKSENTSPAPTSTETDYKALSGQIALNFMKSFSGNYSGNMNTTNIQGPASINFTHQGPVLFSTGGTNPLCGTNIDSTYTNNIQPGDSSEYIFHKFKFTYLCDNKRPYGYIEKDSVVNSVTGSKVADYFYDVSQNYTVKATDITYKVVTMTGGIAADISSTTFGPSYLVNGQPANDNTLHTIATYVLNGVKLDITGSSPDITAGSASFNMVVTSRNANNPNGTLLNLQGTILFLANHQASVTIQGSSVTYLVDLLTGTVTVG
jgi:hypothetical protein